MTTAPPLDIGLIGLDTSHVIAFARLLNGPTPHPGARIAVGWPGGSDDVPLSRNRVEGFTRELRELHGVRILDTPEAVADHADLVFITSVDGRTHLELYRRIASRGKPVFIDKPLATSLADANEIVRLADSAGATVASCSMLRFAGELPAAIAWDRESIVGCDAYGPMDEQPSQPGLFWYGCHGVEMLVAAMGAGCREVRCVRTDGHDLLTAVWDDGRVASYHGVRGAASKFGLVLHCRAGTEPVDLYAGKPWEAAFLDALLETLPRNRPLVPTAEMLDVVAIIEAANRSRSNNGEATQPRRKDRP
ncbi:MAG: Gfo/Idh/MocA family protein [Kiritimatiellia bacterium]|jgi:predicted dehydrogenase